MSLYSTLLTTSLLGSGLWIGPTASSAQVSASDSSARATPDSQPARSDSTRSSGADSASAADSAAATSDSVRSKPPSATASDTAATHTEPVDSILIAACRGAGSTAVARDLLVIVFAPEATAAERTAVAKAVDGSLLGSVTSEPGAYYLRVPSGGDEYQLRVAADRLILLDMVRQVGSRACPPIQPPDTAQRKPS
jgi:hypothetical protein